MIGAISALGLLGDVPAHSTAPAAEGSTKVARSMTRFLAQLAAQKTLLSDFEG